MFWPVTWKLHSKHKIGRMPCCKELTIATRVTVHRTTICTLCPLCRWRTTFNRLKMQHWHFHGVLWQGKQSTKVVSQKCKHQVAKEGAYDITQACIHTCFGAQSASTARCASQRAHSMNKPVTYAPTLALSLGGCRNTWNFSCRLSTERAFLRAKSCITPVRKDCVKKNPVQREEASEYK